jgi:hypothetical protein
MPFCKEKKSLRSYKYEGFYCLTADDCDLILLSNNTYLISKVLIKVLLLPIVTIIVQTCGAVL